ncbi:MAG TPA: dienelactone hydrolase family protein [Flavitalea sp.]|nr:dienelactone hydrolase family protein [Flavitalea sp.]
MHKRKVIRAGTVTDNTDKVLILLHGRGGSPEDILSLTQYLHVPGFAFLAPEATNHAWYPYSFLAPVKQNEPWLSSALEWLEEITSELIQKKFKASNIYFAGFSQGACLTLEFVARHANTFGGIAAFTGGLIGETIDPSQYKGDFGGCPIFIGTSDPDPHIPVERVHATVKQLKHQHATVTERIYKNMGHTITQEEIDLANKIVFGKVSTFTS